MGRVTRKTSTLKILLVLVVCVGIAFYFTQRTGRSSGVPDIDHDDENITYSFSDSTPPALRTTLEEYFEEQGWENVTSNETDSGENEGEQIIQSSDISIYTSDEPSPTDSAIDLYQIFFITRPFNDYTSTTEITTLGVGEELDWDSENSYGLDKINGITPQVSLETKALYDNVSLTPIEKLDATMSIYSPGDSGTAVVFNTENWQNSGYPLIFHTVISGPESQLSLLRKDVLTPEYLRDHYFRTVLPSDDDFVTVIQTGTTVAGGPGWELCERTKGSLSYPIDMVKSELSSADITIISNESSFVDGCSQGAGTTAFCGKPSYIQNLLDLGADAMSLTGNHMCDYGKDYFTETLDLYTSNGIGYFGSGKNSEEAETPLYIDTQAGKIAFIGTNLMGPDYVLASNSTTGAAFYDEDVFTQTLEEASAQADIVWVNTHLWPEYGVTPGADQLLVTEQAVSQGADIVAGVSSHETLGMTFIGSTPVFYGLGNFLFDQMWSQETREGMVVKATLFEGRIINLELMPTVLYDYCQPRFSQDQTKLDLINYFISISSLPE